MIDRDRLDEADRCVLDWIVDLIAQKEDVHETDAEAMVSASGFLSLLISFPIQVHHESVYYWVDWIIERRNSNA